MTLSPEQKTTAGFSLIEAVVAIALMAFILSALATMTAQWLPNWNRGIVEVQRSEQVALGLDRVLNDVAAAEFISPSQQSRMPFFTGTTHSIIFVRSALGPNTRPGLEIVRIAETSSDKGPMLVRTRAPFMPDADQGQRAFTDPVILMRRPYRLSFAYAGADRIWRRDWRDQALLPDAVKLIVRDDTSGQTLSLSSATLIHSEVPVECITAKSLTECQSSLRAPAPSNKPQL